MEMTTHALMTALRMRVLIARNVLTVTEVAHDMGVSDRLLRAWLADGTTNMTMRTLLKIEQWCVTQEQTAAARKADVAMLAAQLALQSQGE